MFNYLFLAILTVPIKHLSIGSIVYVLEDNPNVPFYWATDGIGNEFYIGRDYARKEIGEWFQYFVNSFQIWMIIV